MAVGINGIVQWQIQPLWWNSSNLAGAFWNDRGNYLKSANDSLRYQVIWTNGTQVTEAIEPSANNFTGLASNNPTSGNGDVIAITFKVEARVQDGHWKELGRIKKTRDIASRKYTVGTQPVGHRFTIDVSQLVSGELSYSLCPINKGTWQSNSYGGMNGGLTVEDNVLSGTGAMGTPISQYNVSRNGTYRVIRVTPLIEVINGNGDIVSAGEIDNSIDINVINSVNQFERDPVWYFGKFSMDKSDYYYRFLSRCPNFTTLDSPLTYDFKKPVRMDEQAEYLQFYFRRASVFQIGAGGQNEVGAIGLKVETFLADGSAENTFYLRDFEDNLLTDTSGGKTIIADYQNAASIQNISPYYINNTAALKKVQDPIDRDNFPYWSTYTGGKITASTDCYRVSMSKFSLWANYAEKRTTKYYYYGIDREDEKDSYGFVRFHWLNSMGGTDSYTAKRDVVEGLTISRDVIERKSRDRTWYQDDENQGVAISPNTSYISDTMRGGDIYKGGREVSNVNAERIQSVYTEPLNKSVAKWLEEMMLSPNVWIEMDTDATQRGNTMNPYLRPSSKEYIPVIITNSDVETVNQAEGLVKFNIEYTLAHKVITQRN